MFLLPCFRLIKIITFSITAVILFGNNGTSAAQATITEMVDGLQATLSLDKSTLEVGEVLGLDVALTNISEEPVLDLTASFQFPEGNDISVTVQPPQELAYRYTGALDDGAYPVISLRLEKDKPQVVHMMLLYDRTQVSGLLFPVPGIYQVTVDFTFNLRNRPEQNMVSLPVTQITVTPASGQNAAVLEQLQQPELIRALHLGAAPTTATLEHFTKLGADYRQTDLGALAFRAVALHKLNMEPASRLQGVDMMKQYLQGPMAGHEADRMVWYLARGCHLAGQYDLAREWIYYLRRQYPASIYLRDEDPLVHYYLADPQDFASQVPWFLLKEPWIIPGSTPPTDLNPRQDAF